MKFLQCLIIVVLVIVIFGLSSLYFVQTGANAKKLRKEIDSFDTEIETLQNTQDQWIKQTELLKTVNQLSSNLKFAELEKKELADALNVCFENIQILKSTVQRADAIINKLWKVNESLREQLEERST